MYFECLYLFRLCLLLNLASDAKTAELVMSSLVRSLWKNYFSWIWCCFLIFGRKKQFSSSSLGQQPVAWIFISCHLSSSSVH